MSVWICVRVSVDYDPIQGVFPPHVQCSQDKPQIHHDPVQDKAATEDT